MGRKPSLSDHDKRAAGELVALYMREDGLSKNKALARVAELYGTSARTVERAADDAGVDLRWRELINDGAARQSRRLSEASRASAAFGIEAQRALIDDQLHIMRRFVDAYGELVAAPVGSRPRIEDLEGLPNPYTLALTSAILIDKRGAIEERWRALGMPVDGAVRARTVSDAKARVAALYSGEAEDTAVGPAAGDVRVISSGSDPSDSSVIEATARPAPST